MRIRTKTTRAGEVTVFLDFYDQRGDRVRETVATHGASDTAQGERVRRKAERLQAKRSAEIELGTYVNARTAAREALEQAGPTFAEFADRFLQEYAAQRRSEYYGRNLRPSDDAEGQTCGPIRRHFGERLMREITPGDLDAYRSTCFRVDGVGASTVRKRLIILGTVFKTARRWGVIESNPAADLEKPSEPTHKTRYLSRQEWGSLLDHAEPWLRPILTVAVLTGARLKEVLGLRWENVDRDAGVLFISEDNKTGKPRGIPIAASVRTVLDELPGGRFKRSGFVFLDAEGNDRTAIRERNRVSQRTKAAAEAAELVDVSFHTLRHTAGSWMAQAGQSQVQIAKVLGHATTATTDRYMHLGPAHLRGAVNALEAAMQGTTAAQPGTQPGTDSANTSDASNAVSASATLSSSYAHVGR
jgi:integrase